jgi:hypothetical protein
VPRRKTLPESGLCRSLIRVRGFQSSPQVSHDQAALSKIAAMPWPPPMHIVSSP